MEFKTLLTTTHPTPFTPSPAPNSNARERASERERERGREMMKEENREMYTGEEKAKTLVMTIGSLFGMVSPTPGY